MYIYNNEEIYKNTFAVTNRQLYSRPFLEQIKRICRCHPKGIILREKDLCEEQYTVMAKAVMEICDFYNVKCILHTYFEAAKKLGCTSIHLPLPILFKHSKELHGFTEIGTSVHSVADALEGGKLGATYLTAGHIYATDCKKGVPPRGIEFLKEVCSISALPVYAIGGIKPDKKQLDEVMNCGAKGICIMSSMAEV